MYEALRAAFPDATADTQDGLRLAWPDRWVHVRPSGTEPIVRVIAEAPDEDAGARAGRRSREPLDALGAERSAWITLAKERNYVRNRRIRRTAKRDAALIEGLKRLEYRGYDSAGVAMMNGKGVETRKAKGKISHAREALVRRTRSHGNVGIAHTRWATHGAAERVQRAPAHRLQGRRSPSSTTASSRTTARCARCSEDGAHVRVGDRHRSAGAPHRGGVRRQPRGRGDRRAARWSRARTASR